MDYVRCSCEACERRRDLLAEKVARAWMADMQQIVRDEVSARATLDR
jgi:hypothetical protein